MKLLRQVSLYFQEGRSDKVYEVDLCEVGTDQYVVNFRYGRRGSALRDGTKTSVPVSLAEAQRIYDALVQSKTTKGYRESTSVRQEQPAPAAVSPAHRNLDPRAQAVLAKLNAGVSAKDGSHLSRAAWRAGEMRLREAEPALLKLFGAGDAMLDYCIAWSLGRLGSQNAVAPLRSLQTDRNRPYMVRRIAAISLLDILADDAKAETVEKYISQLPAALAGPARNGPADAFTAALADHLETDDPRNFAALDLAYIINNGHVRPALLSHVRNAPLKPNYFQRLRHIFKAAELRSDGEVFGWLAYRFETERGNVNSKSYGFMWEYQQVGRRWQRQKKDNPLLGPSAQTAFSHATRFYLRKRVWRTLKRLGELGMAEDYVRLATGVLATISDDDAEQPFNSFIYQYEGRRYNRQQIRYDRLHRFWAVGKILFGGSRRYRFEQKQRRVSYYRLAESPDSAPTEREESFPQLWEQVPQALLHLLDESRCLEVHQFASKALRACWDFCRQLDVAALLMLLRANYEVTVELGFELAVTRYDATNPDRELVLALADCGYQRGREQACKWIDLQRGLFLEDTSFAAALAAAGHEDTRLFARRALQLINYSEDDARLLVGRLIAALQPLGEGEEPRAGDICQTMRELFSPQLRKIGAEVIRDLLAHPLIAVQQFAGDVLLNHETLATRPPDDVLAGLLNSSHESVRAMGVRIVSGLPDDALRQQPNLLTTLVRHEAADVRESARPIVARLASSDPEFGRAFSAQLIDMLLIPGSPEGVPTFLSRLLQEELRQYLGDVASETVWRLLQSRSQPAQEVGGALLASNVRGEEISVEQIVRLADHDVLTVRQASWQMCREQISRLKADVVEAALILDSDWEDSRQFAFDLFREQFTADDLPVGVLVSICDSTRVDVQQFGREIVTRMFSHDDGVEYLQRLSEHPAVSMQMFTSNYLDRYASNGHQRLAELEPYFRSVLSRVNQGRIAKDRVFRLFDREIEKSAEHARAIATVIAHQSATAVYGDKARTIELMLKIHRLYPFIELPIEVVPPEVRSGV